MTIDQLLSYASGLEGEHLATAGGRATFTLRRVPHGIEIVPDSSKKPRIVRRETIQLVLDQYEQSRNLQPGQYQKISFVASYLLGRIARCLR